MTSTSAARQSSSTDGCAATSRIRPASVQPAQERVAAVEVVQARQHDVVRAEPVGERGEVEQRHVARAVLAVRRRVEDRLLAGRDAELRADRRDVLVAGVGQHVVARVADLERLVRASGRRAPRSASRTRSTRR